MWHKEMERKHFDPQALSSRLPTKAELRRTASGNSALVQRPLVRSASRTSAISTTKQTREEAKENVRAKMSKQPDIAPVRGGNLNATQITPSLLSDYWTQKKQQSEEALKKQLSRVGSCATAATKPIQTKPVIGQKALSTTAPGSGSRPLSSKTTNSPMTMTTSSVSKVAAPVEKSAAKSDGVRLLAQPSVALRARPRSASHSSPAPRVPLSRSTSTTSNIAASRKLGSVLDAPRVPVSKGTSPLPLAPAALPRNTRPAAVKVTVGVAKNDVSKAKPVIISKASIGTRTGALSQFKGTMKK